MGNRLPGLRWAVEQRLEFIEYHLFWEVGVNRADIMVRFGVSVPQASKDLSQYQELVPNNIRYDRSEKRYLAAEPFKPLFLKRDAARYLMQLRSIDDRVLRPEESWLSHPPSFDTLPRGHVDPTILRTVRGTVRNRRSLEIRYQSLSAHRPKPIWRRVTPHAFGNEGFRWHVRAFCHIDLRFKDFLLPRILKTREEGKPGASPAEDMVWQEFTVVALRPHPGLNEDQREVISRDYGMRNNRVKVRVRLALLSCLLKRVGLDPDQVSPDPRE